MKIELANKKVELGKEVFVAPDAVLAGQVSLGDESSVWFGSVIRGDVMPIKIGNRSNIQDRCVVHGTYKKASATIGDDVSIGHGVILHGCTIKNNVLIGMGSIIMDDVEVGENSLVAAGSLLTAGKKYPANSLIMGSPAKVAREVTDKEIELIKNTAINYIKYKSWYEGRVQ